MFAHVYGLLGGPRIAANHESVFNIELGMVECIPMHPYNLPCKIIIKESLTEPSPCVQIARQLPDVSGRFSCPASGNVDATTSTH